MNNRKQISNDEIRNAIEFVKIRLYKTLGEKGNLSFSSMHEALGVMTEEYDELVHEYGEADFEKRLNIKYSDDLVLYKPRGCDKCSRTGYRGRTGIHELLIGTDSVKKLILESADIEAIRADAMEHGMTTLKQDGIMKIFKGDTNMLQVRKVCIK